MKRLITVIIALLFLSACMSESVSFKDNQRKKPRIPSGKSLQANALSGTNHVKGDSVNIDRLVDTIDQNIKQPVIITEEIERGWYYGKKNEKKVGTPDSWIWLDEGFKSRWISPNALGDIGYQSTDDLCRSTGGVYAISCLERETSDCQFISESVCRCPAASKWAESQGCILTDESDEWVSVTPDDLRRGWYEGGVHEKKLNTPLSWVWVAVGGGGRWQNPRPTD